MGDVLGIIGCRLPVMSNKIRLTRRELVKANVTERIDKLNPESVVITLDDDTGPWIARHLLLHEIPYSVVCGTVPMDKNGKSLIQFELSHKARYYRNKASQIIHPPDDHQRYIHLLAQAQEFLNDIFGMTVTEASNKGHAHAGLLSRVTSHMANRLHVIELVDHLLQFRSAHEGTCAWTSKQARDKFDDDHRVSRFITDGETEKYVKSYYRKKQKERAKEAKIQKQYAAVKQFDNLQVYDEPDDIPF